MIKAFAFPGWETEEDNDDDNFDNCPERLTKELLSKFHQLEQFRFGCAAHSLQLAVKDAILLLVIYRRTVWAITCQKIWQCEKKCVNIIIAV